MKLKLNQLVNAELALRDFLKVEMPIGVSYDLTKTFKKIIEELNIFNEKRNELIKKYGGEEENNKIQVLEKNMESFGKEIKELLEKEIMLNFEKIKIDTISNIKFSIENMLVLDFLFEN